MDSFLTSSLFNLEIIHWFSIVAVVLIIALSIWFFLGRKTDDYGMPLQRHNTLKKPRSIFDEGFFSTAKVSQLPDMVSNENTTSIPGWFEDFPQQLIERLDAIAVSHQKNTKILQEILNALSQRQIAEQRSKHSDVSLSRQEETRPNTASQTSARSEPTVYSAEPTSVEVSLGESFLKCCKETGFFFTKAWDRFIATQPANLRVIPCWYDRMTPGSGLQSGKAGEDSNKVDCRFLCTESEGQQIWYLFSAFIGTANPKPEEFLACEVEGAAQDRLPERITSFIPPVYVNQRPSKNGLLIYGGRVH